jgi:hypothetical protein
MQVQNFGVLPSPLLQDKQQFDMVNYNSPKVIKADTGEFLLISGLSVRTTRVLIFHDELQSLFNISVLSWMASFCMLQYIPPGLPSQHCLGGTSSRRWISIGVT